MHPEQDIPLPAQATPVAMASVWDLYAHAFASAGEDPMTAAAHADQLAEERRRRELAEEEA